jgi:hypothetical protein
VTDPWKEFKDYDPEEQWRDRDKREGHYRFEVLVPVSKIAGWFKQIFGKGRKRK